MRLSLLSFVGAAAAFSFDIEALLRDANALKVKNVTLPQQPGPYQVATVRTQLVDESRMDPWAEEAGDAPQKRKLVLQIWYPILNGSGTIPAPYLPPNASEFMDEKMKASPGTSAAVKTNAWKNGTPIKPLITKDGVLPVVVFSPGSGTIVAEYTTFNAPLASYGYIVIGMDHLYDSAPVELANGELVIGDLGDKNHTKNAIATGYRRDDAMFLAKQITNENLAQWISGYTPEGVKSIKLGIYGQSLGGSTASLAMENKSSPYKAGLSFDGPFYGSIATTGMEGPFLFFAAENSETHDTLKSEWPLIRGWKRAVTLKGTTHYDYSDLNALVPLSKGTLLNLLYLPKMGPIGPSRRTELIADYLQAFFDFSLRDAPAAPYLERETSKYPEMKFESL